MLGWLLDTSMGVPGPQGHWPLWLAVTFHLSNKVAGLCLAAIPLIVARRWRFRRDGVQPRQYWQAMAFLPALAVSRLLRFIEWWGPPYHLTVLADVVSAVTLVYSVSHLPGICDHILKLPSRARMHATLGQLNVANLTLTKERAELVELNDQLQAKLDDLAHILATEGWTMEKALALAEIKATLDSFAGRNSGEH